MAKKGKSYNKDAHALTLPMPSANKVGGLDRYEVEEAARTMTRHQEVLANKKLHRAAKSHLKRQQALMSRATKAR